MKKICVLVTAEDMEEYKRDNADFYNLHMKTINRIKAPDTEIMYKTCPPGLFKQWRYTVVDYFMNGLEVPRICKGAVEAEKEGADAIVIACAFDPGLRIVRTLVDIPVIGEFESTAHVACMLGSKFGVIVWPTASCFKITELMIRNYGLESRAIPNPTEPAIEFSPTVGRKMVESLMDPASFTDHIANAARNLVRRGAEVVFICSTGLSISVENAGLSTIDDVGISPSLKGGSVPILNLASVSLKMAELMVDLQRTLKIPSASRVGLYQKAASILRPGDIDEVSRKFMDDW